MRRVPADRAARAVKIGILGVWVVLGVMMVV